MLYVEPWGPCGLAPQIRGQGGVVAWSDFHTVCEPADDPLDMSQAWDWSPVPLPDLAFDARQYTAEVQRATAAREWDSAPWQTALLLLACLRDEPLTPGHQWDLGFTEPDREHPGRYRVTYWTADLHAVTTVSLTTGPRTAGHGRPGCATALGRERWQVRRRSRPGSARAGETQPSSQVPNGALSCWQTAPAGGRARVSRYRVS